jgi:aminoglycoside phosphotransferase family enzyme/predicted kinase
MELPELIEQLSRPAAFPTPVECVEVVHTHISVVFLGGSDVFKLKKPVDLGFLDFHTLEQRRHFCAEEARLNRRLAPKVYKGVVPVTRGAGGLRFGGEGEPIEWAVHMERLPDADRLCERIERGAATHEDVRKLARRLAEFHRNAAGGAEIAREANFDGVARNLRDALEIPASQLGVTVSRAVWERLHELTETGLAKHRSLIEARSTRGVPRDCHGDLHLDHVYLFPERPPPDDLVAIDCIEFNERFRFIDPVADMCFAYMDLLLLGRADLAQVFLREYFALSGDTEGEALVPLYTSYRAAVRGKVEALKMEASEVPEEARQRAREESAAHWQLALGALETPGHRTCLVLVGGLPGAGKSTLARGLAEQARFTVIRSDAVRKNLAQASGVAGFDLYSQEWTERTYATCLAAARAALFEGQRVIIDATFQSDRWRQTFLESARRWGVPGVYLQCTAAADVVRTRLHARKDDISDADWAVHQMKAASWEAPSERTRRSLHEIPTDDGAGVARARQALQDRGLA